MITLRESILRLFNGGTTTMTTHCTPACSQVLPVKPQGVWARGVEVWAGTRERQIQPNEFEQTFCTYYDSNAVMGSTKLRLKWIIS